MAATPSAAQESPPTTAAPAGTTTTAPTTTAPPPTAPTTTTGDPATTSTVPEQTEADPAPTTTTTVPAPAAPPPSPPPATGDGVAVTFDIPAGTLLVDGQRLGITVSGIPDTDYVLLRQCVDGTEPTFQRCLYEDSSYEIVDGTVRATMRLDALLSVGGFDGLPSRQADCRTTPCSVLVEYATAGGALSTVTTPLPFDPEGPLAPPPTATVTPAGPYAHGQSITVHADGLVWSVSATVVQCAAGPVDPSQCDQGTARYLYLDDGDAADLTTRVLAVIDTASGTVDCREIGACELVVVSESSLDPARTARVPLPFDPATQVVPPVLVVTPAEGLVHGQEITATGSGFTDDFLQFSQCAAVGDGPETCIWLPGFAEPTPTGTFTSQVRVSAFVPTPAGEVDCREADAPCVIVASSSRPDSSRAGRAPLHFDPDSPLPPPPSITVTPSTGLAEEATVTVAGTGFGGLDGASVDLSVCATGTARCDETVGTWIEPAADGTFTTEITVAASFRTWDGTVVDCRATPGCEVTARDGYDGRQVSAGIAFGAAPTMDDRYRLPVFEDVEVVHDVVFRRTADASGASVDLTLDVYEPAGDTLEERPVVVWLAGGWFGRGQAQDMQSYAEAFARRGYVSVTMGYRARPGLLCCPTDDIEGVTAAVADATEDAAAGVRWLRDHADEYGIDPDAIAVGGAQGGAAAAFGLAHVAHAPIAAAVPVDGVGFGRPDRGEAPFLALHEQRSTVAPQHLSDWACDRARSRGTTCSTAAFPISYEDFAHDRQRAIVAEASAFLADVVLAPLGYVEPSGRDWGGPGDPAGPDDPAGPSPLDPVATVVPGAPLLRTAATVASGRLPVTGVELAHLAALALALCLVGGAALAARRRGLRGADRGSAGVWVAAGTAVVLVVAGFAVTSALGPADTDETAGPRAAEQQDEDAATGDVDHDSMDHDSMDHDSMDHGATDHDGMNHTALDHAADGHDGLDHAAARTGHGHGEGAADGHEHLGGPPAPGHEHPGGSGGTGHQHPGGPSGPPGPGHEHPDPPDPEPPVTGFDPSWTPAQVAYAEALIADTQEQLERYDNLAILPLTGYQWIKDGMDVDSYQHWIHLSRIIDSRRLDAAYPESLVLRTTADGPRLEAAMYMLSTAYNLGNIPADIAWLPGWHIHENLCFDNGYELVGVTVNGVCERGYVLPTPPMIHVWRERTECGWFAGVDEFGLQCHHEH